MSASRTLTNNASYGKESISFLTSVRKYPVLGGDQYFVSHARGFGGGLAHSPAVGR